MAPLLHVAEEEWRRLHLGRHRTHGQKREDGEDGDLRSGHCANLSLRSGSELGCVRVVRATERRARAYKGLERVPKNLVLGKYHTK